jgi:uncharacterized protein
VATTGATRGERAIRRYQASRVGNRLGGRCRFEPSCSHYAADAFATRAFPIAFAMTLSRLLRCNPLARLGAHDPVQRHAHQQTLGRTLRHSLRPRHNTIRTLSALMLMSGLGVLLLAGSAPADAPTGGCTGTANGRNAAGITKDDPLVVKKHTLIQAKGQVPPAFQGKDAASETEVKISFVDGLPTYNKTSSGHGDTWASDSVKVDEYFDLAGLYKVEVTNTGQGWSCSYIGYVKVDENPLTTPAGLTALAFAVVGAAGVVGAGFPSNGQAKAAAQAKQADKIQYASDFEPGTADYAAAEVMDWIARPVGCMPCMVMPLLLPLAAMPIFGASGGAGVAIAPGTRTVRVKGHPILGFFGGLLFALGVVVLLQQYSVWTLTILNVIVLPLVFAVLAMLLGYRGRSYSVTRRSITQPDATAAAAEEAPPPPVPEPVAGVADAEEAPPAPAPEPAGGVAEPEEEPPPPPREPAPDQ